MSDYDELLDELLAAGSIEEEAYERIKAASDGSPLRKKAKQLEQEKTELEKKYVRHEAFVRGVVFDKVGIKFDPSALAIPADLDISDEEKVRDWAVKVKLIEPPPPQVPAEEQSGAEQIAGASTSAPAARSGVLTPEQVAEWPIDKLLRFKAQHPDAYEQIKREESVSGITF